MQATSDQNVLQFHNSQEGVSDWPLGQVRFFLYPDSWDCDTARAYFLGLSPADQLAQSTTSQPDPAAGFTWQSVVCSSGTNGFDYSYTFSRPGTDFAGHEFAQTPGPRLTAVTQNKPRLYGNYYALFPQPALNVALFKRIPQFTPHASKILIYPGGLYTLESDNDLIGRGWTHVSESPKVSSSVYPTHLHRALELANYRAAQQAADSLPAGDPKKQKLLDWSTTNPAFEGDHYFIDDESACALYAHYWYLLFKQDDTKGAGVDFFSVNHEVWKARTSNPYFEWYRQVGWITKYIIAEAAADGNPNLKSGMTDWGNLSHRAPYFIDDNDSQTGYPRYMSVGFVEEPYRGQSQSAPIGNSTDIAQLVLQGKAFVGVGRYMQHTTDGQSLFEKNQDGTLKVVNNELVWRTDRRSATICGQATVIYMDDNRMAMIKRYGYEASDYTNVFLRAGSKHLPLSTDRGAGYENIRSSGQFRLDTEIDTGNQDLGVGYNGLTQAEFNMLNSRPLDPAWTEGNAIRMYLCEDYLRGWMETQLQTALGADNGLDSKARASVEIYAKGFQRAANLNWIFDTPYKHIEPKLWLKNQGIPSAASADEQFYRKPIIRGGIATYQSRLTIWLRGEWPCQDVNHTTSVIVWVDKDGTRSNAFQFMLDGRLTFLDYWQLPEGFPDFDAKHVYIQFNSLLGELITWRGDYREAKITVHPTQPALA